MWYAKIQCKIMKQNNKFKRISYEQKWLVRQTFMIRSQQPSPLSSPLTIAH